MGMYRFIYPFNNYLLSTYGMLGAVLGTGNTAVNKTNRISALMGLRV